MKPDSPKLDLSKYKTTELVKQLSEILGLGTALIGVFLITALSVVVFGGGFYWLLKDHLDQEWLIGVSCWGVFMGLIVGFNLGIARIINRGLKSLASVLKLLLNMVELAANDFEDFQSGKQRPTVAELTAAMHSQVIEPCLMVAIKEALGIFAKPVIWFYTSSFGKAVRVITDKISGGESAEEEQLPTEPIVTVTPEQYGKVLGTASKYGGIVKTALRPAHFAVSGFGTIFRYAVVLPLYATLITCVLVAIIPVIILRFFV